MYRPVVFFMGFLLTGGSVVAEESSDEIAELRLMLENVKIEYETRINDLEQRLTRAERLAQRAERSAEDAFEIAEDTAVNLTAGASAPNTFNPAIGAVLVGRYADLDQSWEAIPGFLPGGELGAGESGFSLGESELNLNASIDNMFFGNLTLALEDEAGETEVGIEEAWFQTTALQNGLTLLAGRYFSGLGYLNKFHRHADDFVDRPLPYQAFFGGQYIVDGAQARWIAPTSLFIELGGELNWGSGFPATANSDSSPSAWTLFAHVGGDLATSHSWQLGLSYLSADVEERAGGEEEEGGDGSPVDVFNGDSDLIGVDFVWKWAPDGNPTVRNVKVQGEYFWRDEDGEFAGLPYDGDQTGWYLQGLWQFIPRWRIGYRHDEVDADNGPLFVGTPLEDPGSASKRDSFMLDWSHSEFSRLRLQYIYDRVLDDSDNQLFVQYIMSIGAHGGHQF